MGISRGFRQGRAGRTLGLATAISMSLLAVACGDDDDDEGSATTSSAAGTSTSGTAAASQDTSGDTETSTSETPAPTNAETLKLGAVFSLSGAVAPFSEGSVHAVELAVKQINDAGGFVVGDTTFTLEVSMKDDRSDPGVATASATELVEDEGVKIILGPTTSVTSPAVAETVVPEGILMFSPATALGPMFTPELAAGDNKTLFNTSGSPLAAGEFMQKAITSQYPDVTKVALIYDDGGIGKVIGPLFSEAATAAGLEIVAEEVYPAATTDYSTVLTSIKGAAPELLFVCCTSTANSLLVKQSLELDVAPAFIAWGGSLRPPTSDAIGGPIAQPYVSVSVPGVMEILADGTIVAPRPGHEQYLTDLKDVLGVGPSVNEAGALYFYDYIFMLVKAMEQAGTVDDPVAIADVLEDLEFDGPTLGPITYSDAHFAELDADTCKVTNGAVECEVTPRG